MRAVIGARKMKAKGFLLIVILAVLIAPAITQADPLSYSFFEVGGLPTYRYDRGVFEPD